MALTLTMKQHDLLPIQNITLLEPDPDTGELGAVDLTSASSAKLIAVAMSGSDTFTATLTFASDRTTGVVIWTPITGDTDASGLYNAEIEVTYSTKPETYPNDGYFTIHIVADLG